MSTKKNKNAKTWVLYDFWGYTALQQNYLLNPKPTKKKSQDNILRFHDVSLVK